MRRAGQGAGRGPRAGAAREPRGGVCACGGGRARPQREPFFSPRGRAGAVGLRAPTLNSRSRTPGAARADPKPEACQALQRHSKTIVFSMVFASEP